MVLYNYKFKLPCGDDLETSNLDMELLIWKIKEHFQIYHHLDDIIMTNQIVYNLIYRPHLVNPIFRHRIKIEKTLNNK